MLSFTDLKYWHRSGSLEFMRGRTQKSPVPATLVWQGTPVSYRPGTSDVTLVYRVLLKPEHKREYRLPVDFEPEVILDIGANIGVTSVLMAHRYPRARIFSFEPVKENFELLQRNVRSLPQVRPVHAALGAVSQSKTLYFSDSEGNHGGFSFFEAGSTRERGVDVTILQAEQALRDLDVGKVDLIKIDTEGSEFDILTNLDPQRLSKVGWILGELHGNRDFALLEYLSQWFDISVDKPLGSRLSQFQARNKCFCAPPSKT